MRPLWGLIFCFILVIPVYADNAASKVNAGNKRYHKGEYKEALEKYNEALKVKPDSDVVNFDCGAAAYKNGDYQQAYDYFLKSLVASDKKLQPKAIYNLGNTALKWGLSLEDKNLEAAVKQVGDSVDRFSEAKKVTPKDKDAQYNHDIAQKELKRLKEKLKKQKQQKQDQQQQQKDQQQGKQQQKEEQQKKENESQDKQNQKQQQEDSAPQGQDPKKEDAQGGQEDKEKLSKKEALGLLDDYRDNEEPRELYKEKQSARRESEPDKDW
jgi:Ca-activated chloride channel family protein